MKQLVTFTVPDDGTIAIEHDTAGVTLTSVDGTADGRPAQLVDLPDSIPEGNGAWRTTTWDDGTKLRGHGVLWIRERNGVKLERPEFIEDMVEKPARTGGGGDYHGGPLRAEGGQFMCGNTRYVACLHSDFRVLKMWLDGEDMTAIEAQRKEAGSDGPRVFGSCDFLFKLDPRNYHNYYSRLTDFAKRQADRGACWEYVAYTDRQMTRLGDDHWQRSCEALAGQPGLLMQLVNEWFKNGVDPRTFRPFPNGVPQCPGSFVDGMGPPVAPMWPGGYNAFNPNRNWKWPVTVGVTAWELRTYPSGTATLLIDEPIGADEQPRMNTRASDPALFEKMAVDCALWAAGGVFHSQSGLQSGLWGPVQMACAEAFFRGLDR